MDKKKINFLIILFMLLNIHTYTQELQWQDTNELYQSMVNFVNEEPNEKFKLPKIVDVGLDNYFWALFTKKKREKNYAEQKRIEQQKVRNFIETHFVFNDTIPELIFYDKEQIAEWKKYYQSNLSGEFRIKNNNIIILIADGCFGISCPHIYVFKEREKLWKLVTTTSARLKEMITVKTDNDEEKIVFGTTSGKIIGMLPFNVFDDD